ncbi:M-phase inducer phosphatase, partial [Globisporangium splendens]
MAPPSPIHSKHSQPSSRSDATPADERSDCSVLPKRGNRRALLALFETNVEHDATSRCASVSAGSDSEDKGSNQQERPSITSSDKTSTLPSQHALLAGSDEQGRHIYDGDDSDSVACGPADVDSATRDRKRTLHDEHFSSPIVTTMALASTRSESADPQAMTHEPSLILHKKWKRDGNDTSHFTNGDHVAKQSNNVLRPSFTRSMSSQSVFLHKPSMPSNDHSSSVVSLSSGSPAVSSSTQGTSPSRGDLGPIHKLVLPTIRSKRHPDLNVISPQTVSMLLNGDFDAHLAAFVLIDCRFSYEYDGGKLKGSQSLCDPASVEERFLWSPAKDCTRTALIFYCEFSANRAPKMLRHVRNLDRWIHAEKYPELFYPELYLIDGGYKHCYETIKTYTPMNHKGFTDTCKQEFALWRKRWKAHKTTACAAKFQHRHHCQLQHGDQQDGGGGQRTRRASNEDFQAYLPSLHPPLALRSFSQIL